MRAYLQPAFRVSGTKLLDDQLSSSYTLTPDAASLARLLAEGHTIARLTRLVCLERHVPAGIAQKAVLDIITLLDRLGALRWEAQGISERANMLWLGLQHRCRYPLTFEGSMRAVFRAYLPVGLLLALPYVAAGILLRFDAAFWLSFALPFVMVASFAVHEWGHMVFARRQNVQGAFLAGIGYMAVLYNRRSGAQTRLTAAAGPVMAALGCLACIPLPVPVVARLTVLAVAGIHLTHLLPFTADGRALWKGGY